MGRTSEVESFDSKRLKAPQFPERAQLGIAEGAENTEVSDQEAEKLAEKAKEMLALIPIPVLAKSETGLALLAAVLAWGEKANDSGLVKRIGLGLAAAGVVVAGFSPMTEQSTSSITEPDRSPEPLASMQTPARVEMSHQIVEAVQEEGHGIRLSDIEHTHFVAPYLQQGEEFLRQNKELRHEARYVALEQYTDKVVSQIDSARNSGASELEIRQIAEVFEAVYREYNSILKAGKAVDIMRVAEKMHGVSPEAYKRVLDTLTNDGHIYHIDGHDMTFTVDGVKHQISEDDLFSQVIGRGNYMTELGDNAGTDLENLSDMEKVDPATFSEIAKDRETVTRLVEDHWVDISRKLVKNGVTGVADQERVKDALVEAVISGKTESVLLKTKDNREVVQDTSQFEVFLDKIHLETQLKTVLGLHRIPVISYRYDEPEKTVVNGRTVRVSGNIDVLEGTISRKMLCEGNHSMIISLENIDIEVPPPTVKHYALTGDITGLMLFIGLPLGLMAMRKNEEDFDTPEERLMPPAFDIPEAPLSRNSEPIREPIPMPKKVTVINGNGEKIIRNFSDENSLGVEPILQTRGRSDGLFRAQPESERKHPGSQMTLGGNRSSRNSEEEPNGVGRIVRNQEGRFGKNKRAQERHK